MKILEKLIHKIRKSGEWVIPLVKTDRAYAEDILNESKKDNKNNNYFKNYEDPQLKSYILDKVKKHKAALIVSSLAELDKFGVIIGGEEIGEIPLKGLVWLTQLYSIMKDPSINKTKIEHLSTLSRYAVREGISMVPIAGDVLDISNRYLNQMYKDIAMGITNSDFEKYKAGLEGKI